MGIKNWILTKFFKPKLEDLDSDKLEKLASAYLSNTQKSHEDTLRTAKKLNKARLLRMQEKELREELYNGFDDAEEEEEEEEEEQDLGKIVLNNILKGAMKTNNENTTDTGLLEKYNNLTPEDQEKIKEKFGF